VLATASYLALITALAKASGIGYLRGTTDRVFDLGPSLKQPDWSVNEILATGLPVSITLGLSAMVIALMLGLFAGLVGGLRPGSPAAATSWWQHSACVTPKRGWLR
jgi:ABC-type dipeptide/oligopeptide/nickel transport system permease component